MTWRNVAYWLVFIIPVLVVAAATGSEPEKTGEVLAVTVGWVEGPFSHLDDPLRTGSLLAGLLAVSFTFHRMWRNLRGRA